MLGCCSLTHDDGIDRVVLLFADGVRWIRGHRGWESASANTAKWSRVLNLVSSFGSLDGAFPCSAMPGAMQLGVLELGSIRIPLLSKAKQNSMNQRCDKGEQQEYP